MTPRVRRLPALSVAAFVAAAAWLPQAAPAQKRLVRFLFDGPVTEAPVPSEFGMLMGGAKVRTLADWIRTIDEAGKDASIEGAVMVIEEPSVGIAQIEELTRALKRFRERGKKVWCYLDLAGNGGYALASAADHITLTENGELFILGLHGEEMYLKNLFDKIGVQADMMHCGDYKSALEPFTRTGPSKEAEEQINWLLDGIYGRFVSLIAENRNLSADAVRDAIDHAPHSAKAALERKLIDAIASFPEFKQTIHKEYGKDVEVAVDYGSKGDGLDMDFDNPFAIFQKLQELFSPAEKAGKPGVGVIYIEGLITTGRTEEGLFGPSGMAGSTTIRAAFEKARTDDNIKAVVVRVDSPGGSALASDIMWQAATRCKAEKPLIVSMGNVAGSGGYYVSIPGDVIFAEETTITGSIGVVSGKFVWRGLTDWAGINFHEYKRGARADVFSMNRPWSDAERAWMMEYMVAIYDQFKDRVRQSRGERIKGDLEQLAGGRVYTGRQALERGLVDQIGGLADAIRYAARKADLGPDYETYVLPKPKGIADLFAELFGEKPDDEWKVSSGPVRGLRTPFGLAAGGALGAADPLLERLAPVLGWIAPEQARSLRRNLAKAMIIHREHVGMFMPFDLRMR